MGRLKWYYILSVIFLMLPLLVGGACDDVIPPESGLPVINHFYADPDEVGAASSAVLHWDVSGASTVIIEPGIGDVALSGSEWVAPNEDITYMLTASNEEGSVTARARVIGSDLYAGVVEAPSPHRTIPIPLPPQIYSFSADPESIVAGDSSILSWEVSNADIIEIYSTYIESVRIYRGEDLDVSSSGSISVTPHHANYTETYRLIATNSTGSRSALLTVTVTETAPPILPSSLEPAGRPIINSFEANPESITLGDSSRLSWEVSNADFVEITSSEPRFWSALPSSGSFQVSPTETTTYNLTVSNAVGSTTTYIRVIVEATIHSFEANPESITLGDSSRLSWEVSNADFVEITSSEPRFWSALPSSGSFQVSPTETTSYQLTVSYAGGTINEVVTVTVGPATPTPPEEKAKPDLVITDIWKSGSTQWHYIVKNQGNVECSGSSCELRIDGTGQASQSISPLAPGESRGFYFSHKFACESGTTHTWSVVADSKNAIDESNEGNNSRTEKFTCSK